MNTPTDEMVGRIVPYTDPQMLCAGCGGFVKARDWHEHFRDHSPEARKRIEDAAKLRVP